MYKKISLELPLLLKNKPVLLVYNNEIHKTIIEEYFFSLNGECYNAIKARLNNGEKEIIPVRNCSFVESKNIASALLELNKEIIKQRNVSIQEIDDLYSERNGLCELDTIKFKTIDMLVLQENSRILFNKTTLNGTFGAHGRIKNFGSHIVYDYLTNSITVKYNVSDLLFEEDFTLINEKEILTIF